MKIRLWGLPEECAEVVKRLRETFDVVSVSPQKPDQTGRLVRVYVEVRL
jgi:hypothetical protein